MELVCINNRIIFGAQDSSRYLEHFSDADSIPLKNPPPGSTEMLTSFCLLTECVCVCIYYRNIYYKIQPQTKLDELKTAYLYK